MTKILRKLTKQEEELLSGAMTPTWAVLIVLGVWVSIFIGAYLTILNNTPLWSIVICCLVCAGLYVVYVFVGNRRYLKDLREGNVYVVQGILRMDRTHTHRVRYALFVGGLMFSSLRSRNIEYYFNYLRDGITVRIEFSQHSMFVWDVEEVEDGTV